MRILIAGSGKMGSDIFYHLFNYPLEITWLCLNENEKQQAESAFLKKMNRQLRAGIISNDEFETLKKRIRFISVINEANECEFVIEAIWENPDAKQKLFQELNEVLPETAIFTTNTSSIPIKDLIPSKKRHTNFAGLHFFFPLKLHNIVEINTPELLDDTALQNIIAFLSLIETKYLILPTTQHFLLNRLLLPLQNEAYRILSEGLMTIEEIDDYVKVKLFPAGVFEFFDHVGIDIMLESVKNYSKYFTSGINYSELISSFQGMVSEGKLGLKCGKGFYQYPRHQANHEIISYEHIETTARLEKAFYGTIKDFLTQNIVDRKDMVYAISEYLGTDFITSAKAAGYNF